jgi:glycyl-tRNA synthetase (class II)
MTTTLKGQPFDRQVLDSMLRRRMFYTPSFEVYGGVAGLYDYGPVSCTFLSLSFERHKKTERHIEKAAKAANSMT